MELKHAKKVFQSIVDLFRDVMRYSDFQRASYETDHSKHGWVTFILHFEYQGDGVSVPALLSVCFNEGGFSTATEQIRANIYLYARDQAHLQWNESRIVTIGLPIFSDGNANLVVYPYLLKNPAEVSLKDAPANLRLLISAAVKHLLPLVCILERASGWSHSVSERWTNSFFRTADATVPSKYSLVVTSTPKYYDTRTFNISADPLSDRVTVNGVEMPLADLETYIVGKLGFRFFKQQFIEIDKRLDILLLHSKFHGR